MCVPLAASSPAPESGQDVHSLQRSEKSSLAEAYVWIGSAYKELTAGHVQRCSVQSAD
jgi:hypothetical protein